MVLRDMLNPSSSWVQLAYGAGGMTASYIPLAQSAAMQGLERYGVALWGASTFVLGLLIAGTAVSSVFNYLKHRGISAPPAPGMVGQGATAQASAYVTSSAVTRAAQENVRKRMHGRLADSAGGVALAAAFIVFEPNVGKLAGGLCLAFSACKAGAAVWDYGRLLRQRKGTPAP